jgi:hypothetical protein
MRRVLVPIGFSFVAGARHPGGRFSAISGISPTSGEQGGSCRVGLSRFGSFGRAQRTSLSGARVKKVRNGAF